MVLAYLSELDSSFLTNFPTSPPKSMKLTKSGTLEEVVGKDVIAIVNLRQNIPLKSRRRRKQRRLTIEFLKQGETRDSEMPGVKDIKSLQRLLTSTNLLDSTQEKKT